MPTAQKFLFGLLVTLVFTACSSEPQDFPPAPPTATPAVEAAVVDTATPVPPTPTAESATANEGVSEPATPATPPVTMTSTTVLSTPAVMTETEVMTTPIAATETVTITITEPTPAPFVAILPDFFYQDSLPIPNTEDLPDDLPSEAETAYYLAVTMYAAGSSEEALVHLDEAIALYPEFAAAYEARGNLYYSNRDWDQALENYNQALDIDPALTSAYLNRSRIYLQRGEMAQAINDYNRLVELNPDEVEPYLYRARLYLESEQNQQALPDLEKVLELDPENALAYLYRGVARRKLGETENVIPDFSAAIELEPRLIEAYVDRGLAYQAIGETDKAVADYQQALKLDPTSNLRSQLEIWLQLSADGTGNLTPTPGAGPGDQPTPTAAATAGPPTGEPVEVQLDQPFILSLGQSGRLAEANLTLTFQEVLEDSRCPALVDCFWSGQAIVAVAVQQEGSAPGVFALNNNPALKQESAAYQGHIIRFTGLDPYPQYPDEPIPPEAYQVTLVVSKQ
jgi:tetratricopeptide (TPR) repeat protein